MNEKKWRHDQHDKIVRGAHEDDLDERYLKDRFNEEEEERRINGGEAKKRQTYQEKIQSRRAEKEAEYQARIAKWEAERPKKPVEMKIVAPKASDNPMIEVICNDRLGGKVRVKCYPTDTISNLKLLVGAHTGTRPEKIRLQKGYSIYKDHILVEDYEIKDGM